MTAHPGQTALFAFAAGLVMPGALLFANGPAAMLAFSPLILAPALVVLMSLAGLGAALVPAGVMRLSLVGIAVAAGGLLVGSSLLLLAVAVM